MRATVAQPKHRAPKQRERAGSEDEMDEADRAKVDALASAQRGEEARRDEDAAVSTFGSSADQTGADEEEDEEEVIELVEGEDVSEGDLADLEGAFGAGALSDSQAQIVDSFMAPRSAARRTLADMILDKIAEKEHDALTRMEEADDESALPEKVIEAYRGMVPVLNRYRCGKLPKAFKVIPALERWEDARSGAFTILRLVFESG